MAPVLGLYTGSGLRFKLVSTYSGTQISVTNVRHHRLKKVDVPRLTLVLTGPNH